MRYYAQLEGFQTQTVGMTVLLLQVVPFHSKQESDLEHTSI
jgi:hypothetical protein